MASYSSSDSSYQTLMGYKHAWCLKKVLVLRRLRENAFCRLPQWVLYPVYDIPSNCNAVIYYNWCNSTQYWSTETVCNQRLVVVSSSSVSHAAIEMVQWNLRYSQTVSRKKTTHIINNHISSLSREPHMVRLLVRNDVNSLRPSDAYMHR